MLPTVTIIGRPNVGKSTLFNALIGKRKAITSDISGTTRDNIIEKVFQINSHQTGPPSFWLVDTAGLTNEKGQTLEKEIKLQIELSIQNADLILFIIDGKKELTADDYEIIEKLRKSKTQIVFAANKIDDANENQILELAKCGLGTPLPISAKNYTNIWDLQEEIEKKLKKTHPQTTEETANPNQIKLALVGRPNVGKSSLLNKIISQERTIVSDIAGTTRDTIDIQHTDETGQTFTFLDTAGLRKPGKIERNIEFWSTVRTQKAIEEANICVLLIDAMDGVTHQDLVIAGKIIDAGKGIILGVNKFDLIQEQAKQKETDEEREVPEIKMWGEDVDKIKKNYINYLSKKISFLSYAPVLFFSAKTGKHVPEILVSTKGIFEEQQKRIPTAELNKAVEEIFYSHVTPSIKTKRGKIKYVSQVEESPPKFLFFVNNTKAFHFTYKRYLENQLRKKYGFFGTPIIIELRDQMEKFRGRQ